MGAQTDSLEYEIEQTRAEMEETLDAIKEKLDPEHLKQQAKAAVREATIGRVEDMVSSTVDRTREFVGDTVDRAQEAVSSAVGKAQEAVRASVNQAQDVMGPTLDSARSVGLRLIERVRANPILTALVGLGVGWLWFSALNRRRGWQ